MIEAKWWKINNNGKILCYLCPRYCTIGKNQHGFCYVRQNRDGKLYSIAYGKPTGFGIDPIEKKPLNHFLPGTTILSFGTAGCNLGCKFCQNWSISKAKLDELNSLNVTPEGVIDLALRYKTPSIAFTYNEPTIFGEFVIDISKLAKEVGIKTVMVTDGYISKEAREDIYKFIDGANVDLKAFTEDFYRRLTFSHLQTVLDTLMWLKKETNVWLEITTLLIPGENDSSYEIEKLSEWILNSLGADTPIHFTAFHPDFKMRDKPPTSHSTLRRAREIALEKGLKFVYVGNVFDREGQTTFCPNCKVKLIERDWHSVLSYRLVNGRCHKCGEKIPGIFYTQTESAA